MKLAPSQRLVLLGLLVLGSLAVCARHFGQRGELPFLLSLSVAGVIYLLGVREFFATSEYAKRTIFFGLALAAVWHLGFLSLPPGLDDDVHRYVWDGRVQRLGYNPYLLVPSDPTLASLHTPETRTLNNPEVPSPYPPGAQLFFRGVTAIHESVFAMKVAFVLCDFAIVFVLWKLLRWAGQREHLVLVFAWNPLLAVEVAGSGHVDILGVFFLVLSAAALFRRWRTLAAVAFGLSVAVKFVPIVLLPLFWKRVRLRDAAVAAAVVALLYAPFLDHGRIPLGSLGTYVQRFRFNDPVFATLERFASPPILAGLAALGGLVTAIWMRSRSEENSAGAFAWPVAASLFCAPVVYPWYLLWFLPFLWSARTWPLLVWTVSIVPTYYVWHLRTLGRPWVVPEWMMFLEYGSVAIAAFVVALRKTRSAAPNCSEDR